MKSYKPFASGFKDPGRVLWNLPRELSLSSFHPLFTSKLGAFAEFWHFINFGLWFDSILSCQSATRIFELITGDIQVTEAKHWRLNIFHCSLARICGKWVFAQNKKSKQDLPWADNFELLFQIPLWFGHLWFSIKTSRKQTKYIKKSIKYPKYIKIWDDRQRKILCRIRDRYETKTLSRDY